MSGEASLLASFVDVAELGSFSAAARRRGLSQPAISLQIRQLERRLGVRLVERLGRTVGLTTAGHDLLPHAVAVRTETERAIAAVAPHRAGEAGRVRIGTGATACIYLLPPVLRRLRERMPGLSIIVQTGNAAEMVRLVEENALDLGFVTLPVRSRSVIVEPVRDDEMMLAQAADAPPLAPDPTALASAPLVLYEGGGNTRGLVDAWFSDAGLSARPLMQLGSVEAIKQLVGAGLGASILPGAALSDGTAGGRLRAMPLKPPLRRTLGIVLRRDKVPDRSLREAVGALRELKLT